MKAKRRPAKDVIKGASPEAIRRAAGISPARVAAVRRIMAELGLDTEVAPPKRPATGKRSVRQHSAARSVARAHARSLRP